jgi:ABC-type branched-subunit amino acid transport system ATPase component
MSPLLELTGVTRRYAGLVAVDNVDMQVSQGGIHALIGPNGAGKTTLFNLISGVVPVSAGRIRLAGEEITPLSADRRARLRLARTFQNIRIFGAMTVRENVLTGLHAHFSTEHAARETANAALELVGLSGSAHLRAAALSYGDQRRLELARAMAASPRLLLLDEPAAGMNPAETEALAALVRRLPTMGTTVLLVEHDMHFVMGLADEVTVLNFGRRICFGRPETVRNDPQVIEAYLGHGTSATAAPRPEPLASETLLTVENLRVAYGRTIVLKGVDLTVKQGQVVCLIGANGAGKTTSMRALSGLVRPAGGRVRFATHDITGLPPSRIASLGLLQVPEGRQVFPELTVDENLTLGAYLMRDTAEIRRRREQVLQLFPRLRERLAQLAGLMSGGEQQMLAMARALMGGPKMLLLDEPSMGLAPLLIDEIFAIIAQLKRSGTTILLVEQNAAAALAVADYAYVLETGRIVLEGKAAEIAKNPAVMAAYLGG